MLHKTKAIILRSRPYGDTSLIVSAYTDVFGLQSYMVKGARGQTKKRGSQAMYFQPAALLEMVVYHNELKQLQSIKEVRWHTLYNEIHSDVTRNSVALFMVELFSKNTRQSEPNPELFAFMEDNLRILDETPLSVTANLPLHYALHLAGELGFRVENNYNSHQCILDLREGRFTSAIPDHPQFLDGRLSEATSELLNMENPVTLYRLKLNQQLRRQLLDAYIQFYQLHIPDFGQLRSIKVLEEVLS